MQLDVCDSVTPDVRKPIFRSATLDTNKPVISLLLPTRGRPNLVYRLFQSISKKTSLLDRIEVVLYIDEDDVESHALDSPDFHVVRIIGPKMTMGGYNSTCLEKAQGDILMIVNDDMVFGTPGWDEKVIG